MIVTVSAAEQAVDAGDALSLTWYEYELAIVGTNVYVLPVCPDIKVVHDAPTYHLYLYGVVPDVGFAVRVTFCPKSIVGFAGVIAPADTPEVIVIVPDFTLFIVSGVVALSVMMTFACRVLPTMFDGTVHAKLFDVPATAPYTTLATIVPVIVLVIR